MDDEKCDAIVIDFIDIRFFSLSQSVVFDQHFRSDFPRNVDLIFVLCFCFLSLLSFLYNILVQYSRRNF